MKWKRSKKQTDGSVRKCPNCGEPIEAAEVERPKKWYEKTSITLCIAAVLALMGLGFIHIITGVVSPLGLPYDFALKESFGYRETFVNARKIEAIPYTAAKLKYPRGCLALQQRGYLESGEVFEARMARHLREDMKQWQTEFERRLEKPSKRWQDRLAGYVENTHMDPEDANSYNNRGITSARAGAYEAAISSFTRAVQRNPVFAEAYFNRGLVYVAIGQLGGAIENFGKAVEIKKRFAQGYFERGLVLARMGQHDQAVSDFARVIEIDPTRADVVLRRSLVCCEKGEYHQAWEDVHAIESLGLKVPTGYLAYLRAASGRQK